MIQIVRLLFIVTLSTLVLPSCRAQQKVSDLGQGQFETPPLEQVGTGALLVREFVYPLDQKPTADAHASTLVETPDGIMVAFFAGANEGARTVGIRLSLLSDGKWSWPVEVANGFVNDTLTYPTWNPVLFQPKDGPLHLYYKQGPHPLSWWGMVKTSDDNGRSWSYGKKLGEDEKIGALIGPVKNKPVQLADGTLLNPSSTEIMVGDEHRWMVHFERSTDNGKTWQVIGPINDGIAFDAIQPSILELPDGRLTMLARTKQNVIAQSWSSDKGLTWTELEATNLPNPNSGTDAVTLRDGRHLLIYNHKTQRDGERGRDVLNLAISSDGKDWKPVMTIENEPNPHGYAYPAIIQTTDGLVHATYTYDRTGVKHVVIDPSKL